MPVKFQKESWFDGFGILLVPYPWFISLKTLQSGLSALAQNVIAFRKKKTLDMAHVKLTQSKSGATLRVALRLLFSTSWLNSKVVQ